MPQYRLQEPASERETITISAVTPGKADNSEAGKITRYRAELDQYFAALREFKDYDISEILRSLAAFSARASEIRSNIFRVDTRRLQAFRTRELDPFIEELDRQFKVWSRFQAVREMEFKMSGGGM